MLTPLSNICSIYVYTHITEKHKLSTHLCSYPFLPLHLSPFISLPPSLSHSSLLPQLEMITDLLGAPSLEDVHHITSHTAIKSLLSKHKPPALQTLYTLAPSTSHGAVHLLSQMLVFNPVSTLPRWTADCKHYQYTLSVLDTKMTSEAGDLVWPQYWSVR